MPFTLLCMYTFYYMISPRAWEGSFMVTGTHTYRKRSTKCKSISTSSWARIAPLRLLLFRLAGCGCKTRWQCILYSLQCCSLELDRLSWMPNSIYTAVYMKWGCSGYGIRSHRPVCRNGDPGSHSNFLFQFSILDNRTNHYIVFTKQEHMK
jgi:hypothetical protein